MQSARVAALAILVLGMSLVQVHPALAATITDCPFTEASLSTDISNAGSGGTVSLVCSSATTIPFNTPILVNPALTIAASQSPGAVTLDGQKQTQLLAVDIGTTVSLNH